jgi:antitoxin component of RelBE/YafQ-DinJ toxin-antitoxin module
METMKLSAQMLIERDVKVKAEAAVVANGMSISEYIRRVMAYAANGGDLSIVAGQPSGIYHGRKTA